MLKSEQVIPSIADAYYEAALAGVNMRAATEALEAMRATMLSDYDLMDAWDRMDAQVNLAADVRGLQPTLMRLREHWKKIILDDECERLKGVFEHDREIGWIGWLHAFVDSLTNFRLDYCRRLCEAPLPFPEDVDPSFSQILRFTDLARGARWAEAFDLYARLGEQEKLMPNLRARSLAIAAEISVYQFYQFDRAKALLERAESLAPGEWRVTFDWGIYYLQKSGQENAAKAKECYQRLTEIAPDLSGGYTGIGECLEREGDLAGAEELYYRAAKCVGSPSDGYLSLLKLFGQKAIFEDRKDSIPDLVDKLDAIASTEYSLSESRIAAGDAYKQNDRINEAIQWYQRAIESAPSFLHGYSAEAYLYLDNKEYANAEDRFRQVIDMAPEAMDGYWGMSQLTEARQDWEATIKWLEESLKRRPQWAAFIHARSGKIKQQLNRIEDATEDLFKALAIDPENGEAIDGIERIAYDMYTLNGDPEAALALYRRLREAAGEIYEVTYRNLIGNVRYYFGRNKEAAAEYRRAILISPKTPRIYSNLASALSQLKTPGNIVEELDEAIENARVAHELEPDSEEYAQQLAELERARTFAARYGEHALALDPAPKPIQVHVTSPALPIILNVEQNDLSEKFKDMIEAMRGRIRSRFGFSIPGVNFKTLDSPGAFDYMIDLLDERAAYGELEADKKFAFGSRLQLDRLQIEGTAPYPWMGSNVLSEGVWIDESNWEKAIAHNFEVIDAREYLLRHVEIVVTPRLNGLFSHQDAANLLAERASGDCADVERDPRKLSSLTLKLKEALKRGEAIGDLTLICEEINRSSSDNGRSPSRSGDEPSSSETAPGVMAITLHLSGSSPLNRENLSLEFASTQNLLFVEQGVIIPQIAISESDSVGEFDFQLQINDEKLVVMRGLAPGEFWINIPFDDVKDLFPNGRASVEPNYGTPATILNASEDVLQDYARLGYGTRDPLGYVVLCVAAELRRRAAEMLTREVAEHYLSTIGSDYPALVKVARYYFSPEELTRRLREMLSMGRSIRNIPWALETLLDRQQVFDGTAMRYLHALADDLSSVGADDGKGHADD
jgi:tetratricopeptide (TPR) repeat protein